MEANCAMARITPALIGVLGPILAETYTHTELDALFHSYGFPGDPPPGNKVHKCQQWMRLANRDCADPLSMLGRLIAELMEQKFSELDEARLEATGEVHLRDDPRRRVMETLAQDGLSYQRGGYILGSALSGPTKSLGDRLKVDSAAAVEVEYRRAYANIEQDPQAALTAACAILESVCKTYLETEAPESMPSKQVLGPLWQEAAKHLGLSPKDLADNDLKRILQGLFGIADGVASLRTHEGSAHGRAESSRYRLKPRHPPPSPAPVQARILAQCEAAAEHLINTFNGMIGSARDRGERPPQPILDDIHSLINDLRRFDPLQSDAAEVSERLLRRLYRLSEQIAAW
jgi:hypothetical protein